MPAIMIHWRAVICHFIIISIPPLYYTTRLLIRPNYLITISLTWPSLTFLFWIYFITQISIPVLTHPALHLPAAPNEHFPFGHFSLTREEPVTDLLYNAILKTPNDGIIVYWDIFYLSTRLILTTPESVMDVLNTRSYDWIKLKLVKRLLTRILGDGLIIVEGNQHKVMRKSVAPAFSGRHIRELVPLFWSKGMEFADSIGRDLERSVDGTVEVMNHMSRVTLDIMGGAALGMDFDTVNSGDNKLARLYETITTARYGPTLPFFLIMVYVPPWLVMKLRGTVYSVVATAIQNLRESIRELLVEKKQAMDEKTAQKDILAIIMRSGEFSDDYLADQLLTFLAAGHDTTASALTWTLLLLAQHPHAQDRLREECKTFIAGKQLEEIDADVFEQMPYLTAVCNETLRLYPTVPGTSRVAVADTSVGGVPISKGQIIIISTWSMNRMPSLWGGDSTKFKPDRWLDGPHAANGGATTPYAFTTFLHGPRSCIGQTFARVEMKCLLAALVLRFRFEIAENSPEVIVGGFITIKPKGGLRLKLHDLAAKS